MNCLLFLAFISWVGMFDNPASAASWKIPLINYWYGSWNRERPSRLVQTVRERCLIYLNMRAGPAAAGREKSMQMIIYDRCRTLPKAQFRSLYNFGRKPVGVESIYQLLELQSGGCHKCHKCLGILRKSDFSEHRKYSCLVQIHLSAIWNKSEADSVRNVINGSETRVADDSDS